MKWPTLALVSCFSTVVLWTGCGSSGANPTQAVDGGGSDAYEADAGQGGDGAAPGDAAQSNDGTVANDASAQQDGSTSNDASAVCPSDACETCLLNAHLSACQAAVSSCSNDTTCSQALQQLWTCRCGDGGQCSLQCDQRCASYFYAAGGSAGKSLWMDCGQQCPACAFN